MHDKGVRFYVAVDASTGVSVAEGTLTEIPY